MEMQEVALAEVVPAEDQNQSAVPANKPSEPKERQTNHTPYYFYCKASRAAVKKSNPEQTPKEISKILTQQWKALSEEGKAPFEAQSAASRQANAAQEKAVGKKVTTEGMEVPNTDTTTPVGPPSSKANASSGPAKLLSSTGAASAVSEVPSEKPVPAQRTLEMTIAAASAKLDREVETAVQKRMDKIAAQAGSAEAAHIAVAKKWKSLLVEQETNSVSLKLCEEELEEATHKTFELSEELTNFDGGSDRKALMAHRQKVGACGSNRGLAGELHGLVENLLRALLEVRQAEAKSVGDPALLVPFMRWERALDELRWPEVLRRVVLIEEPADEAIRALAGRLGKGDGVYDLERVELLQLLQWLCDELAETGEAHEALDGMLEAHEEVLRERRRVKVAEAERHFTEEKEVRVKKWRSARKQLRDKEKVLARQEMEVEAEVEHAKAALAKAVEAKEKADPAAMAEQERSALVAKQQERKEKMQQRWWERESQKAMQQEAAKKEAVETAAKEQEAAELKEQEQQRREQERLEQQKQRAALRQQEAEERLRKRAYERLRAAEEKVVRQELAQAKSVFPVEDLLVPEAEKLVQAVQAKLDHVLSDAWQPSAAPPPAPEPSTAPEPEAAGAMETTAQAAAEGEGAAQEGADAEMEPSPEDDAMEGGLMLHAMNLPDWMDSAAAAAAEYEEMEIEPEGPPEPTGNELANWPEPGAEHLGWPVEQSMQALVVCQFTSIYAQTFGVPLVSLSSLQEALDAPGDAE
eukprot:gene21936-26417_t